MDKNILVAYASKYGATREIAEKIGEVLQEAGLQADISPVNGIRELNAYKAVILGSAIYVGKWQKEAAEFLRDNEKSLAKQAVWLFSSGPTGEGDPLELIDGKRMPAELQPVAERIHPRDIAVFGGYINPDKVNFIEKMAVKNLVKKPFGDFRDWHNIVTWSTKIAEVLKNVDG